MIKSGSVLLLLAVLTTIVRGQDEPRRRRPTTARPVITTTQPVTASTTAARVVLNTIPEATEAQLKAWNSVVENTSGVAGNEFFGRKSIGTRAARSECGLEWYAEWHPIIETSSGTGSKRTLCGNVLSYSQTTDFIHEFLLCDTDRNFNVRPFPQFSKLLAVKEDLMSDYREKIHVELDLPDDVGVEMFSQQNSLLKGSVNNQGPVCVYGPWVIDSGFKGKKVEIHPAEQVWMAKQGSGYLSSTADYSQRFDEGNARWVSTPMLSRYAIPFEVAPGGPKLWYRVDQREHHNMSVASSDGLTHELAVREPKGERVLVHVGEQNFDVDYTDIEFRDVVRRPDGTVQGFIVISSKVGTAGAVGGHISHSFGKGHAPVNYNVEILSVKRLAKNSFKVLSGQKVWTFPNPLPADYDEKFARVMVHTSGQSRQKEISMNVGETVTPGLHVSGTVGPWDRGATFRIEVRDNTGFTLGHEKGPAYVRLPEFGQVKTVELIKSYHVLRGKGGRGDLPGPRPGISTDPANPPPPDDGPVDVPEGETVVRFEVRYRITSPPVAPRPPIKRR